MSYPLQAGERLSCSPIMKPPPTDRTPATRRPR